ncbi:MAG: hypothetical protein IT326_04230 [Anaerolineae bacterium]|nr:hypothetical protein [Anaerolineae bacterium]
MYPQTMIPVILEDEILGERVPVDLDAVLPVSATIEALAQLRRLPRTYRGQPAAYELIRDATGDVLHPSLSLAQQGIAPGEVLILARPPMPAGRKWLIGGLVAGGLALVACIGFGVAYLATSSGAGRPTPTTTLTQIPTLDPTALALTPTVEKEELESAGPASSGACTDDARFAGDVSVPDGTKFAPNEAFTKTWRMMNTGTCEWDERYQWVFVSEERMGGPESINLVEKAPGGTQINISVALTAPAEPGTYRGYWQMRNPSGALFGESPYVEIIVSAPASISAAVAPQATTRPDEVVRIAATATRSMNTILIVVSQGGAEKGRQSCSGSATCTYDFGGAGNSATGEFSYTAYACDRAEGCEVDAVDRTSGSFTINAEQIDAPARLDVSFACCQNNQYSAGIIWPAVEGAATYEVTMQMNGKERVLLGTVQNNAYALFPTSAEGISYPITFAVRACTAAGTCSGYTSQVVQGP